MSDYSLLLRKELKEMFSFRRKEKKKIDIAGLLITLFLTVSIIAVVVLVFGELLGTYTEIPEKLVLNKESRLLRLSEIMTFTYAVITLINVFAGIKKINRDILRGKDIRVLVRLPLHPSAIFLSKLTSLFISQLMITSVTLIPLTVTVGVVMKEYLDIFFWFRSALMIVILPMISLLLGAALSMVSYHIVNFLKSHFVILTVLFIILLAGGFIFYSQVLDTIAGMLVGSKRDAFFSSETMRFFGMLYKYLYPANLCARFVFGNRVWLMLFLIVLISGAALFLAFMIVLKILNKVMKAGMEGTGKNTFVKKSVVKKRNPLMNLIKKEFIMVLRTPSYTFQFFATALTMPVMVYCLIENFSNFLTSLASIAEGAMNFELTITIIMMLSVLTNTFCASNISREGQMFNIEKTMPISYKQFVFSKIIFCSTVSLVAIFASSIIACIGGFVTIGEALLIFLITSIISVSEIMFATRKDLNKPNFANNDENEIKESTETISIVILLGIIVSGIISMILLILGILQTELFQGLAGKMGLELESIKTISILFITGLVVLISGSCVLYLLKGLSKRFYNTVD